MSWNMQAQAVWDGAITVSTVRPLTAYYASSSMYDPKSAPFEPGIATVQQRFPRHPLIRVTAVQRTASR